MAAGELLVDAQLPQGDDPQALALETRQQLAGEAALEGVGLDQDQRSALLELGAHGAGRLPVRAGAGDYEAGAGRGGSPPGVSRLGGAVVVERPGPGLRLLAAEAWRAAAGRAWRG